MDYKSERTKLEEQLSEKDQEWFKNFGAHDIKSLDDKALNLTKEIDEVDVARGADEKLAEAKQHASDLAAPYRDSRALLKRRLRYILLLLRGE